jgi:hypothetical protein
MPGLVLLFLLVVFRGVSVLDQTYQVPPDNWRYVDSNEWQYPGLEWKEGPAIVNADFTVESGPPITMMLMDRANLDQLKHGELHEAAAGTTLAPNGRLGLRVASPRNYVLVLENRGSSQTTTVHVRVKIDSWDYTELTPERRLAVIALSFGVFFGIVTYSGAKLWRAFKR